MWKLGLNNLNPEGKKKPTRKEVLDARRNGRIFRWQLLLDVKNETARHTAQVIDNTILASIPPKTLLYTIDPWVWAGEIMSIYEVIWRVGEKLSVRLIYAEASDISFYDPSSPFNEHAVDARWIQENVLAIQFNSGDTNIWPLELLGYSKPSEQLPALVESSRWITLTNQGIYKNYHGNELQKMAGLFSGDIPSDVIQEIPWGGIQVKWIPYTRWYQYGSSGTASSVKEVPVPLVWAGYWYSKIHEFILEEIQRRYAGRKVILRYKSILFSKDVFDDTTIESDAPKALWTVRGIERRSPRSIHEIALENGIQNGIPIQYIPQDAFITGFTIELAEGDWTPPYSLKNFIRDTTWS